MDANKDSQNDFFYVLWQGRLTIVAITLVFAVAGVVVALSLPNQYRAEVLLAPAETEGVGGLSSLASQFGGIASLTGLSLPAGDGSKTGEALALLKSRSFIQSFIQKRRLLPYLLALDAWDVDNNKPVFNSDVYENTSGKWVRTPPKGKVVVPTPWEGYDAFIQMLDVGEVAQDGTLSIGFESLSPTLSMKWLMWLVEDLNKRISTRELDEAKRSIVFLKQQIESTPVQELQTVFYNLIEEQTKKILLGEVREEYVFKVLAEPVFPEDKSSPSRGIIVIALTFLGGLMGVMIALIRSFRAHA